MFKKSSTTSHMVLYSSPEMFLGKRAMKSYSDPKAWHNVFFDLVTSKIDEDIFSVLYKGGNKGAPTASVRILVAMSILKEGSGCSDENLYADGAYQSPGNRSFAETHLNAQGQSMKIKTGRMQGGARFILREIPGCTDLEITDTRTGTVHIGKYVNTTEKRGRRWRIKIGDGDWRTNPFRYFEEKDLTASLLRQEIESLPVEEQHRRNNVEVCMFQYSFHTRNNKTRYRGLRKHLLQALRRCAWMNMRRLAVYITRMSPEEYGIYRLTLLESIMEGLICVFRLFSRHWSFFKKLYLENHPTNRMDGFGWIYHQNLKYVTF